MVRHLPDGVTLKAQSIPDVNAMTLHRQLLEKKFFSYLRGGKIEALKCKKQ
jgi:hypothetical protein